MNQVELIERQILELNPVDRRYLLERLGNLEADAWDDQIEHDAKAGKLQQLENEARTQIKVGLWREL